MCEKCVEIDTQLERYRKLAPQVMDAQTAAAIQNLIQACEAEKRKLHPEPK
jgi:hypothetical protein